MNDFAAALAPKSDQINAMDLIGQDMTITITGVRVTPGTEQPVSISIDGSSKVWRPCKTTGRILMAAWGADTSQFVGRSVQLCHDPKVKWGGMEVGGIRIRALSHIDQDLRIVVAESKQVRKPITVARLATKAAPPAPSQTAAPIIAPADAVARAKAAAEKGTDGFRAWFNSDEGKGCRATNALSPEVMAEIKTIASGADAMASRLADDPFPKSGQPPTATEIESQIRAEQEARDRELEGR